MKALQFNTYPFYFDKSSGVLTKTASGELPFYWINEINLERGEVLPFFAKVGPLDFLFIRDGDNDEQIKQSLSISKTEINQKHSGGTD